MKRGNSSSSPPSDRSGRRRHARSGAGTACGLSGTPIQVLRQLGLKPPTPISACRSPKRSLRSRLLRADSGDPLVGASDQCIARCTVADGLEFVDAANGRRRNQRNVLRRRPSERVQILHNLSDTPLKASPRIPAQRAARAIETLEMAAFAADVENFTLELAESLILPWKISTQVVNDAGGEPLACAGKALGMPSPVFQRVLCFSNRNSARRSTSSTGCRVYTTL